MIKLMLTGFGGVMAAAVLSAILMVANKPAQSAVLVSADHSSASAQPSDPSKNSPGRVVLLFTPTGTTIDRN